MSVALAQCAVIGGGAWGTAIADRLVRNGHIVALWAREVDVVDAVNTRHENPRFLAGAILATALRARYGGVVDHISFNDEFFAGADDDALAMVVSELQSG